MELSQLRYFKTVAQTENLTQSAKVLLVSQPTLSHSISRLEEELEVQLFERSRGRLHLNDAGETFLQYVELILSTLEDGVEAARETAGRENGRLHIATSVHNICLEIMRNFMRLNPGVSINQTLCREDRLLKLLIDNEADFAFSNAPLSDRETEWTPLLQEEIFILCSGSHPMAHRRHISLAELAGESFACNTTDLDNRFTQEICASAGFLPNIVFESDESPLIRQVVEYNLAMTFVPAHIVKNLLQDTDDLRRVLRLDGGIHRRATGVNIKKGRHLSKTAGTFLRFAVEMCARLEQEADQAIRQYFG